MLNQMSKLSPSASAVFWMLTALGKTSQDYGITELQRMSFMHSSTFFRGLADLKARGIAEEHGNSVTLNSVPEDIE